MKQLIELKAPEVDDLLNRPPKGLVRWGSGVIVGILILLLAGSYVIRYPEYVEAKAVITTVRPPIWLNAGAATRIQALYGSHQMRVKQGQLIAVLENPANADQVLTVKKIISDSTLFQLDALTAKQALFDAARQLGDVQPYWSTVANRFMDFYLTNCMDNHAEQKQTQFHEISLLENNLSLLERRINNQERSNNLRREQYNRDKHLWEKGVIAAEALQATEQEVLDGQQALESIQLSYNETESERRVLMQTVKNNIQKRAQNERSARQAFEVALKELATAIERWEQTYLLVSPCDGSLSFPTNRFTHQQVSAGERLFAVIPAQAGSFQVLLNYSAAGFGRVKKGQALRIFLDGYSYLEFGTVGAVVASTALMPDAEAQYSAVATLESTITTNVGKHIEVRGELTGQARIHTRNLRLIQRLFDPLIYAVKTQQEP